MSLSGEAGDSSYNHRVTGNLEKSITPNKDGQKIWGKNITSKIKVDNYLGLGIGIEQVSVRIDMAHYGDELDQEGILLRVGICLTERNHIIIMETK